MIDVAADKRYKDSMNACSLPRDALVMVTNGFCSLDISSCLTNDANRHAAIEAKCKRDFRSKPHHGSLLENAQETLP